MSSASIKPSELVDQSALTIYSQGKTPEREWNNE